MQLHTFTACRFGLWRMDWAVSAVISPSATFMAPFAPFAVWTSSHTTILCTRYNEAQVFIRPERRLDCVSFTITNYEWVAPVKWRIQPELVPIEVQLAKINGVHDVTLDMTATYLANRSDGDGLGCPWQEAARSIHSIPLKRSRHRAVYVMRTSSGFRTENKLKFLLTIYDTQDLAL